MIKKLKILVYGLVVMAFLQETCMPMPGFYEPAVEYTKETHESREELICLSVRKVTPLMRSHTSFYNLFLIPRKSDYCKLILKSVSFDQKLLKKEYRKSLRLLSPLEAVSLKLWLRENQYQLNRKNL